MSVSPIALFKRRHSMLLNSLYYNLKPFIPNAVRRAVRRAFVKRKLQRCREVWPIHEPAGSAPEGWPGWPDGKQFALVLTHDVECSRGVNRVRQVRDLELDLGFRSSFNLVPERYAIPPELRDDLTSSGFEVGVHGLKHDGKLYRSRRIFQERAKRINEYLRKWGAVGFRSPFMHHNLEWIHDLEILYDASTFDTDPFEPQPDGVETIFPFWVPGREPQRGYVELPYTLPQDSTLFLLMEQPDLSVWKQKMEWVVARGGMVLLDTHPDYMNFNGSNGGDAYPARYYAEFLRFIKTRYSGMYWHALPREVARYAAETCPGRVRSRPLNVCMLSYSFYESDNRIIRYASSLATRGDNVDVIALRRSQKHAAEECLQQVRVARIQDREQNERGKWTFMYRLLRFTFRSSLLLARRQLKQPYDVVHVHNVPDFLVFAAWLPRLLGARIVLDIHDIVPEFFASKFGAAPGSLSCRLLKRVERLSCAFADHVIVSNHLWGDRLMARSVEKANCSVIINSVDLALFFPRGRTRGEDGKLRIIFPGGLQWHQGLDIAIEAFALLRKEVPAAEFHIYGDGGVKKDLVELARKLGVQEEVSFYPAVPIKDVPQLMADADLAVVPKRSDSFGNEAYSTKIMEFMTQGVPVIVSRTEIDQFYFNDRVVSFFESGDAQDLARKMLELSRQPGLREDLVRNGYNYVARHAWANNEFEYLNLIDTLATGGGIACHPAEPILPVRRTTSLAQRSPTEQAVR
jgi:glycosyltransferase involved in cell wall biosynthesis